MISVILPTCNRPTQLVSMLESLRETTKGYRGIEVIALVDEDAFSAEIAWRRGCVVDYSADRRSVLSLWNQGLRMCHGGMIHPAMDDLIYHEGWLEFGLESHKERLNGCGVIGFNDLAYDGNLQVATQFMFDRQYCKDYMGGVIAPPVYTYLAIDLEINERAKLAKKFYWDNRAIVEHCHSAHGKRAYDEHDKWKDDNLLAQKDGAIFEERRKNNFPITWEPMI